MTDTHGIAVALAKAQAEFGPIKRDRTVTVRTKAGGTYSFSYAPLESIMRATLPALTKHGIALTQAVEDSHVVTRLLTENGELSNRIPILVSDNGPQAYGSGLTYSRRYGITLLLGVCADDDDDANLAEGNSATVKNGNGKHTGSSGEPPEGFDSWWADMEAVADEGTEALSTAWGQSSKVFRAYVRDHMADKWNALKGRADQ